MSTDTKYVPIVSVCFWKYDFWHDFYLDIHQQIWLWTILVFFINGEIMSCQLKSNVLKVNSWWNLATDTTLDSEVSAICTKVEAFLAAIPIALEDFSW